MHINAFKINISVELNSQLKVVFDTMQNIENFKKKIRSIYNKCDNIVS